MALVVKYWKVTSRAAPGEPNVSIIARESGLLSFVLSLFGIDATTTLQVSARHVFHERGALSGYKRTFFPLEKVASTSYGRHKPWKKTAFFVALSILLGNTVGGFGGALLLVIGTALSLLYYFLRRNLSISVTNVATEKIELEIARSLIEGQEIDEKAAEGVVRVIEHLIKPTAGVVAEDMDLGSPGAGSPTTAAAPQTLAELGRSLGIVRPANTEHSVASARSEVPNSCPKCGTAVTLKDAFCGGCGHQLKTLQG